NPLRVFPVTSKAVFFTSDNKTVMLEDGEKLRWLDVDTGKITGQLAINGSRCRWSADGKRVACAHWDANHNSWHYSVWDLDQGAKLGEWTEGEAFCALSSDGALLAIRSPWMIGVFRVADKQQLWKQKSRDLHGGWETANPVLFLPDSKTLIAAEGNRV